MRAKVTTSLDVRALWNKASERLNKMSLAEKRQTFVDAGILTAKGNFTKPYQKAFRAKTAVKEG